MENIAIIFTLADTPCKFKREIISYWLNHFFFEIGQRKVDVLWWQLR